MTNDTDLAPKIMGHLEKKLNQIVSVAPGVIFQFQIDANGEISFPFASPRLLDDSTASAAVPPESAQNVFKLIHADDIERVEDSIITSKLQSLPWQCDFRVHHDGRVKWVRGRANQERGPDNSTLWNGMLLDITDLKTAQLKLEESERRLHEAQELASIGNWYAKMETGEVYWSDVVFKIFGLEQEHTSPSVELVNRHVHPEDLNFFLESQERATDTGKIDIEHRIVRPDGTIGWVHAIGETNQINGTFHGTIQDITERKHAERELRELATTDPLTRLYNRRFFVERSESTIKLCDRLEKPLAVVMFDLDRFKVVNDTYGHATGDVVLQEIARAVKSQLRSEDVLGRIGGEEFAITLPDTTLLQGVKVAEKLRQKIEEMDFECTVTNERFKLTCSFGVTESQTKHEKLDKLLSLADNALYAAKRNGRNRVEAKV